MLEKFCLPCLENSAYRTWKILLTVSGKFILPWTFKLYFSLLSWVNKKHNIDEEFTKEKFPKNIDVQAGIAIRNQIFQNPECIDDYLDDNINELTEEEYDIIRSWRSYFVYGDFYVVKHLKKYSVFMNLRGDTTYLYGVIGLNHPIADLYHPSHLPIMVTAVLLPFKGRIIYDDMLSTYNIHFGSGIKSNVNDDYRESKEKYGIVESLPFDGTIRPKKEVKATPKKEVTNTTQILKERVSIIESLIKDFCEEKLGEEFLNPCLHALGKLNRKRPSPLLSGKVINWACGIVYAIASNNYVFDRKNPYFMSAQDIADWFGISKSYAGSRSSEVTKILKIQPMSLEYAIESMRESREMIANMHNYIRYILSNK